MNANLNVHVKRVCDFRDFLPDVAESKNSDCLSGKLRKGSKPEAKVRIFNPAAALNRFAVLLDLVCEI